MAFTEAQTQSLLAAEGVGKTVLQCLRQMGLDNVTRFAVADAGEVPQQGAALTSPNCRKNSPQAEAAIEAVAIWAKAQQDSNS